MYEEKVVLCGANSYEKKYYLNPDFEALPQEIQDELKILCVLYTEDVGGILTLVFEEDGTLCFEVTTEDFDPMFDENWKQAQDQRDTADKRRTVEIVGALL